MTSIYGVEMELSEDEKESWDIFMSAKRFSKLSPDAIDGVIASANAVLTRRYPDQNVRVWLDRHGVTHVSSQPR